LDLDINRNKGGGDGVQRDFDILASILKGVYEDK